MADLAAKRADALRIIREGLGAPGRAAALFRGDPAGVVLLRLLKEAGAENIRVLFGPPLEAPFQLFRFADKLRRMWGLEMYTCRTDVEVGQAMKRLGLTLLLTSDTGAFEGGACSAGREGYTETRPLLGFSMEEAEGLARVERLPVCSIYYAGAATPTAAAADTSDEDEEVARRLKGLGYM